MVLGALAQGDTPMTATLPGELITLERLSEVFDYDPQTGEFRWKSEQ